MEKRRVRRLAAIFAANAAGSVRHMNADGEGTSRALKDHRETILSVQIAAHRGRIVKTIGDVLLAEFSSLVDAADCACSVQLGMAERNEGVPPERRLEFRIGINLGDVIIDGGDIFGDGVNIATRLGTLAEPGGICVSKIVMDQLRDKRGLDFHDLGEQSIEDIARPVRVYRLSSTAAKPSHPAPQVPAPGVADRVSIAVLPFTNMTGDVEQDALAEGIVEDITTALSQFTEFLVMARHSSFADRGRSVDVRQVAQRLGVRYVLEGSLQRAGNRLRITSQLIETASHTHLWTDRFDGAIDDVFDFQDRITESVVGALAPMLRRAENERARRRRE